MNDGIIYNPKQKSILMAVKNNLPLLGDGEDEITDNMIQNYMENIWEELCDDPGLVYADYARLILTYDDCRKMYEDEVEKNDEWGYSSFEDYMNGYLNGWDAWAVDGTSEGTLYYFKFFRDLFKLIDFSEGVEYVQECIEEAEQ